MPKSRAQSERIFRHVGRLVITWNDLELQFRRVLFAFTETHEDFVNVATLTADMQADALFKATKAIAKEQEAFRTRLNQFLHAIAEKTGHPRLHYELPSEHVDHLCRCADRLRLYRNYYAHGITSPFGPASYTLSGITARVGLQTHDSPIKIRELSRTIAAINRTMRYAQKLERCISQYRNGEGTPSWPKKIPIVPELKKTYRPITSTLRLL
jgi:hypothetical protein